MQEISTNVKNLISEYGSWKRSLTPQDGVANIHVDEVASKVAAFYEQIRTVIDWKKEMGGLGPPSEARISREEIKTMASQEGLTLVREMEAGTFHFGLIFKIA